jgi:hypothetical protein
MRRTGNRCLLSLTATETTGGGGRTKSVIGSSAFCSDVILFSGFRTSHIRPDLRVGQEAMAGNGPMRENLARQQGQA